MRGHGKCIMNPPPRGLCRLEPLEPGKAHGSVEHVLREARLLARHRRRALFGNTPRVAMHIGPVTCGVRCSWHINKCALRALWALTKVVRTTPQHCLSVQTEV